jgi:hypothetical protein
MLADILLTEPNRPILVNDCGDVIDAEVRSKSGVGGFAIKAAYRTVKAVKPGIIRSVVSVLVDDFVSQLEPTYDAFNEEGGEDITSHLRRNAGSVAEALLVITDRRAEKSRHRTLCKAYKKLRPKGRKHVIEAIPRIGAMLAKHGI